jgi:hypothetical protein
MDNVTIFWMQLLTSVVVFGRRSLVVHLAVPKHAPSQVCSHSAALCAGTALCENDSISCAYPYGKTYAQTIHEQG